LHVHTEQTSAVDRTHGVKLNCPLCRDKFFVHIFAIMITGMFEKESSYVSKTRSGSVKSIEALAGLPALNSGYSETSIDSGVFHTGKVPTRSSDMSYAMTNCLQWNAPLLSPDSRKYAASFLNEVSLSSDVTLGHLIAEGGFGKASLADPTSFKCT